MRIGRRTFILGTGLAAAAPAFADLLGFARAYTALPPEPMPSPLPADADGLVFRIDGWSARDDVTPDGAPQRSDEVWISINQSWRTSWR
jgi:hypothetical protein